MSSLEESSDKLSRSPQEARQAIRELRTALLEARVNAQRTRAAAAALPALHRESDERGLVARITELLVPEMADLLTIDLFDDDGQLKRVATAHADPLKLAIARALDEAYPPDVERSEKVKLALSTRAPVMHGYDDEAVERAARDPKHRALLLALSQRSRIVVPIAAGAQVLGVMRLSVCGERTFSQMDCEWAADVASYAAWALVGLRRVAAIARIIEAAGPAQDLDTRLGRVAQALVPSVADTCCIDLVDGSIWRRRLVAFATRGRVAVQVTPFGPPLPHRPDAPEVKAVQQRRAIVVGRVAGDDDGPRAQIAVPISIGDRVVGTLALSSGAGSNRTLDESHTMIAEAAAFVAAIVLDTQAQRGQLAASTSVVETASNEVRASLTAMRTRLEAAFRALPPLDDADTERFARVDRQVGRVFNLLDELVDGARAVGTPTSREMVDLSALVEGAAKRCVPALDAAACALSLDVERGLIGFFDPVRMDRAIGAVLSNVAKHAPWARASLALRRDGDYAVLSIIDGGPGIAPHMRDRLLGRVTGGAPPSGIGLVLVRQIVEAHGGRVALESAPSGTGAQVVIELPLPTSA